MRWISRPRKEGTTLPNVRTIGKYGSNAAVISARLWP
jgi:hypothetical protein